MEVPESTLNNFKYLDLSFFANKDDLFFVSFHEKNLTGIVQIGQSNLENILWLKFVTIHPNYRNQGVSKELLNFVFSFYQSKENIQIDLSSYTTEGEVLIPLIEQLAQKFSNIKIRHKLWDGPYQNAKNKLLKINDTVYVESKSFTGFCKIIKFSESLIQVLDKLDQEYEVSFDEIIFKK